MGQQQLLLLVLGIVIVGLAVVAGIQAFSENQVKANADAMVNDALRIASDAQAWRLKPAAFGGGAGNVSTAPWTGLTFSQLGYVSQAGSGSGDPAIYNSVNGNFTLGISGTELTVTGDSDYNTVTVVVNGTTPDNITTTITPK